MSLPSQTSRTTSAGRAPIYRRTRRGRTGGGPPVMLGAGLMGLVVVGVGLYIGVRMIDGWGREAAASTPVSSAAEPDRAPPEATDPGPRRPAPAPVTITQGPSASTAREAEDGPVDPLERRPGSLLSDAMRRGATTDTFQNPSTTTPSETGIGESPVTSPDAGRADPGPANVARQDASGNAPVRPLPVNEAPAQPIAPAKDAATVTAQALDAAQRLVDRGDPLVARELLSTALRDPTLDAAGHGVIRRRLSELNDELVFGPKVVDNDPLVEVYEVQTGDRLSKIAAKRELTTHWRLIQRVNGLSDPNRIRVGQKLKLVRGPFHAIVDKSEYRLDLYYGPPGDPAAWTFVRSFTVGLGESGSTPTGDFIVRRDGKLENPGWVNPRNPAERYDPDDPRNPIGDFWVGLDGVAEDAVFTGYGLHGTIEPDSIGRQMSMGCVRLGSDDIAMVFECMAEGISRVRIVD